MQQTILIIDDHRSIRETIAEEIQEAGYRVLTASNGKDGLSIIASEKPDIVLCDVWMPVMDGIETLKQITKEFPEVVVIMMSGSSTIESAVTCTKLGAYDYIEKPAPIEKMMLMFQNIQSSRALKTENNALRRQIQKSMAFIGQCPRIEELRGMLHQVAPTSSTVLITGQSGTGKEIVAHTLHTLSNRYHKPFIDVNCAAIPESLIESELFGHERGAFTGAHEQRRGKFDLADGGTLFLDEIGDMALTVQAKLLRVLQEQKFERVGGSRPIKVDVRIVAATNQDLRQRIRDGEFRADLFHRINVIELQLPPLHERTGDIRLLAEYFLREFSLSYQKSLRSITETGIALLDRYRWPGNIRELRNLMERIMILTTPAQDGQPITDNLLRAHIVADEQLDLPGSNGEGPGGNPVFKEARREFEKEFIERHLAQCDGNVPRAAQLMQIPRSQLYRKIEELGIDKEKFAS